VGVQDNFFEIGGNSVIGVKLIAKLAEQLSVAVAVTTVFRCPTVAQMTTAIESLGAVDPDPGDAGGLGYYEGVV
jgi:phthiocerol/phenolphthiocerol synthesis type-I polyketide synthase E